MITIKYADSKTSKDGKPWMSVKDTQGNQYSCWEQYLFHLLKPGATIDPIIATKGKYSNITGVMGIDRPNPSGGVTVASNQANQTGMGIMIERLFVKIDTLQKSVDWLVEERKTFGALPKLDKGIDVNNIPF